MVFHWSPCEPHNSTHVQLTVDGIPEKEAPNPVDATDCLQFDVVVRRARRWLTTSR
jgi:hypothetical protein